MEKTIEYYILQLYNVEKKDTLPIFLHTTKMNPTFNVENACHFDKIGEAMKVSAEIARNYKGCYFKAVPIYKS